MKQRGISVGIRGRLLWMFALLMVVPVAVLGILSYSNTEIMEISVLLGTKESLSKSSSNLAEMFADFEQELSKISASQEVRLDKVQPGIVWDKIENLPKVNRPELTQLYADYFGKIVNANLYFHRGFIATDNGAYYVGPIYDNENLSAFDPTSQDWYKQAVANPQQVVWSEPTFDANNGTNNITLAKAILDDQGKVIGVAGFDVDLRKLSKVARHGIAYSTLWIALVSIAIGLGIAYWFSSRLTNRIYRIKAGIEQVASGDYAVELDISGKDELADLSESFNHMVIEMRQLLCHFREAVVQVRSSSDQVSDQTMVSLQQLREGARAVDEIAIGAAKQAEDIEQGSHFVSNVSEMITRMARSIEEMDEVSRKSFEASQTGLTQMKQMEKSVVESEQMVSQVVADTLELHEKSARVGDIIGLIKTIANQTNLLALNAAIEAARAGEHGRGFAVVADEVRKLAEQSAHSTQEITDLLAEITGNIDRAAETMNGLQSTIHEQSKSFERVNRQFQVINASISEIESKANQLTDSVREINESQSMLIANISNIASISEETAASAEEVAATTEESEKSFAKLEEAAENLRNAAQNLEQELKRFLV